MSDGTNHGMASDRLLVRWNLSHQGRHVGTSTAEGGEDPRPIAMALTDRANEPWVSEVAADAQLVGVQVPVDIEQLRRDRPGAAERWRQAVREALGGRLAGGWLVTAFDDQRRYLLERP